MIKFNSDVIKGYNIRKITNLKYNKEKLKN